MAGTFFTLRMLAVLDTSQVMAGLKMIQGQTASMQNVAGAAVGAGAIAVAGGMIMATKAAIDWEDAYAGVKRTVDTSDMSLEQANARYNELEGQLRSIGREIPITHDEIAKMAQTAGALGVPTESIDEFTKTAATLSRLSDDLSAEDSAFHMGKIRTIFGIDPDDLDNFASAVVGLGVKGASTEGEILSMAAMAGGAMSLFGAGVEDVLAFSSAFANVNVKAEAGGSAIQKMFLNAGMAVSEGNKHLAKFAEYAGMTTDEFSEWFRTDPAAAITQVVKGLSEMEDPLVGLRSLGINQARWTRGWASVISAQKEADQITGELGESMEISNKEMEEGTLLGEMAGTRFDTTAADIARLQFALHDLGITLGKTMIPIFRGAVEFILPLVQGFNDLLQSVPGLTAVLGPLVGILSILAAIRFGAHLLSWLLPMGPMGAMLANAWTGIFNTGILTPIIAAGKGLAIRVAAMLGIALGGPAATAAAASAGATTATAYAGAAGAGGLVGTLAGIIARLSPLAIPFVLVEGADQIFGTGDPIDNLPNVKNGKMTIGKGMFQMQFEDDPKGGWGFKWPWESGGFLKQGQQDYRDALVGVATRGTEAATGRIGEAADNLRHMFSTVWSRALGTVKSSGGATGPGSASIEQMLAEIDGQVDAGGDEVVKSIYDIASEMQSAWDALSEKVKPPKNIGFDKRMGTLRQQLQQAYRQMHISVKKNDPVNAGYWLNRVQSIRGAMGNMRNNTRGVLQAANQAWRQHRGRVSKDTAHVGADAKNMGKNVRKGANDGKNGVQSAVNSINTLLHGVDLATSGTHMMNTWASGIRAGIGNVLTAAIAAAAAVRGKLGFSRPPLSGPLHDIRSWGPHMIDQWIDPMKMRMGRVRAMGDTLGTAITPNPRLQPVMPGLGAVRGARPGVTNVYRIGTLIADDGGIDELDRRIQKRKRMKGRGRMRYKDPED